MPIVINPSASHVAAPSPAAATPAPVVLQPGTVVSARVLQILSNGAVQISIGGQPIDVVSQVPLQAGQTLQLAVSQTADSIRLAIVSPQAGAPPSQAPAGAASAAATADTVTLAPETAAGIAPQTTSAPVAPQLQLTPPETLAVTVAAQTAATQQTSLATLFANLGVAAGLNNLPAPVQQAIGQVLSQQVNLDQNLTGETIQQAFQNSGLFLEASLASGSAPSSAIPDLKAALIVLRQVLSTSLNSVTATPNALATLATAVVPNTLVAQSALATPVAQSALATPSATVAASTVQTGATPQAVPVPQGATSAAAVAQPGVPVVSAQQGAVTQQVTALATAVAQQGIATPAIVPEQAVQGAVQPSPQPVTITLVPEAPTAVSPALAPLLASGIATPQAVLQGTAVPVVQGVLNSGPGQIILPATTANAAASVAALNLLQEALQAGPLTAGDPSRLVLQNGALLSLLPAVAGARISRVDDAEIARTNVPPPPLAGALPAAQPVMPATLVTNSPAETAMHHLLTDTEGAIARQTLLQVASLPGQADTTAARPDLAAPRWNFEIPFATSQGTAMAQFEISRDGGGGEVEATKRVWRARFTLDVEPAGPVHALISLSGEKTSVRMWAERPATAAQLRAGASQLSQALSQAELVPGDIVIRAGAPAQTASAPAGHFLDRAL